LAFGDSPKNQSDLHEGIVVRAHGGHCLVVCDEVTYRCQLRGRLKQGQRRTQSVVVVGDSVRIKALDHEGDEAISAGVIEEVLPRRNKISRYAARRSGGRIEQVLMANLDQVVAVQSLREPAPQTGFVDRLLVAAENYGVAGVLCLNKCDLDPGAARDPHWDYYQQLGYIILRTSAVTGRGLASLRTQLRDRISLLLGASGVGKSSLLNRLEPGLELKVREVGSKSGLGRHTTERTELFKLGFGGFIADSPGIRGFDPWDIAPISLGDYFPDWQEPASRCRFRTCLHRDEPDCGVKEDVARGIIPPWRYEAYLALMRDLEDRQDRPGGRLIRK
jgi:ribosome biogenesis GTPase